MVEQTLWVGAIAIRTDASAGGWGSLIENLDAHIVGKNAEAGRENRTVWPQGKRIYASFAREHSLNATCVERVPDPTWVLRPTVHHDLIIALIIARIDVVFEAACARPSVISIVKMRAEVLSRRT